MQAPSNLVMKLEKYSRDARWVSSHDLTAFADQMKIPFRCHIRPELGSIQNKMNKENCLQIIKLGS